VEFKLNTLNLTANTRYQSPNSSIAKLEFKPTSLNLKYSTPGIKRDTTITVTARNADFNITNISISNAAFTLSPSSFSLKDGEGINLTVSFLPPDSGYIFCKFTFENDLCPAKFYASGGFPGKKAAIRTLKLIQPNGGEVFLAGSDTVITWEGVSPYEPVTIEYRTDDNQPWIKLTDSAKGLSYKFHIPKIASDKYLARVTAKAVTIEYDNDMVLIPAGTFQMGNTSAFSGESDETPVHSVTISRDFLMSKYEVTQKQYVDVMGTNPSYFKGDNLPVEKVNWYEAVDFCNKLSEKEDLQLCYSGTGDAIVCDWNANGYRLPTEAEWEYACKAGSTTDFYNGSLTNENCSPLDANLDQIGWYCGNENTKTRDVGLKQPNAFGLYDMIGNVFERCWDWFSAYTNTAVTDPVGPTVGSKRVFRGGSWDYYAYYCRGAIRLVSYPGRPYSDLGFRVVRTY
jgi:formylglycine-generating enzyme required for sulfatase activity